MRIRWFFLMILATPFAFLGYITAGIVAAFVYGWNQYCQHDDAAVDAYLGHVSGPSEATKQELEKE